MQTPDKKKQMFHDMQEHPEKYSDEQIETMMDNLDRLPDVDAAWQKFQRTEQREPASLLEWPSRDGRRRSQQAEQSSSRRWLKAAASIIGILMLSGIAYAAVHIISRHAGVDEKATTHEVRMSNSPQRQGEAQPADSTTQSRLYDNVHLGDILDELSTYYHIKVVYYTEDARHPRLYYQWKQEYTIEKVVEMLNNFEWLQMELKNDTLYVKSTAIPVHDC